MHLTKRLYETNPELDCCRAQVVSCVSNGQTWRVELDQTVLFPEGGGQLCDLGTIDGEQVRAVLEEDGHIYHLCDVPFEAEQQVQVVLDRELRLFHSQQHTGEHILSHAFWKLYGAKNVGFHSGERLITIDLDQELDRAQCAAAERYANQQIWNNSKVNILYRDRAHMEDLGIRKVTEKADGLLRIVAIEGGDVCTCCGTHVERTGSVGVIKIASIQRHRGGTRLEVLCGSAALEDYEEKTELTYRLSCALSCGTDTMEERIEALKGESRALGARLRVCSARLMDYTAAEALRHCGERGGKKCVMVPIEGTQGEAKQLLNRLTAEGEVLAGVFFAEGERVGYMLSGTKGVGVSCREAAAIANGLLNGKGGGSESFAQGSGKRTTDWQDLVEMVGQALLRMM